MLCLLNSKASCRYIPRYTYTHTHIFIQGIKSEESVVIALYTLFVPGSLAQHEKGRSHLSLQPGRDCERWILREKEAKPMKPFARSVTYALSALSRADDVTK